MDYSALNARERVSTVFVRTSLTRATFLAYVNAVAALQEVGLGVPYNEPALRGVDLNGILVATFVVGAVRNVDHRGPSPKGLERRASVTATSLYRTVAVAAFTDALEKGTRTTELRPTYRVAGPSIVSG